jgi:hypothetical protein
LSSSSSPTYVCMRATPGPTNCSQRNCHVTVK